MCRMRYRTIGLHPRYLPQYVRFSLDSGPTRYRIYFPTVYLTTPDIYGRQGGWFDVQRCPITRGLDSQKRTEDGLRLRWGTGWGISPMHIHRAPSFQVLRCQLESQPSHIKLVALVIVRSVRKIVRRNFCDREPSVRGVRPRPVRSLAVPYRQFK